MTRQKKEILKRIDEIERFIEADMELGAGFAPPDFYRPLEEEAWQLYEELAHLRHYGSAEEMMHDTWGTDSQELPFR